MILTSVFPATQEETLFTSVNSKLVTAVETDFCRAVTQARRVPRSQEHALQRNDKVCEVP